MMITEKDIVEILKTELSISGTEKEFAFEQRIIYPLTLVNIAHAIMDKIKEDCEQCKEDNDPDRTGYVSAVDLANEIIEGEK